MLLTMAAAPEIGGDIWGSFVMRGSVLIGLTFSVLIFGAWTANLVCYHPQTPDGIDPMAPIKITIALN